MLRLAQCAAAVAVVAFMVARCRAAAAPSSASIDLGDGVTMRFVLIPAGAFIMGSPDNTGEEDEWPQHKVAITRPFYLGQFEVTQAQWEKLMGANPSEFKGAQRPVDSVSWNDCQRFLEKLAARTGRKFALPTEAQWEYACRAGSTTAWSFGERPAPAGDYAWLGGNSDGKTHDVGGKKPNAWGLYDMHGNVWEWCADFYEKHAYDHGTTSDPQGPAKSEGYILRGGAWGEDAMNARSALRNCNGPDGAHNGIGFRCVMLTP